MSSGSLIVNLDFFGIGIILITDNETIEGITDTENATNVS